MESKKVVVDIDILNYVYAYANFELLGSFGVVMAVEMNKEFLESKPIEYAFPTCSSDEANERMKEYIENAVLNLVTISIPDINLDKIIFNGHVDRERNSLSLDSILNRMGEIPEHVAEVVKDLLGLEENNNGKED